MWEAGSGQFTTTAELWRWEIDTALGQVSETQLDDRPIEFARVADNRVGLEYKFGYAVSLDLSGGSEASSGGTLVKYDLENDQSEVWDFGKDKEPGEFVFVERDSAKSEDDGWLIGYVYDKAEDRSILAVLDASAPGEAPLAEVILPRRVPFGFHGSLIWDD